jgi:hypothetical protein
MYCSETAVGRGNARPERQPDRKDELPIQTVRLSYTPWADRRQIS